MTHLEPHSAEVEMSLLVNGKRLSVGQLGPDFLILDEVVAQQPCEAVIEMRVDDDLDQWSVRLPEGIASPRVPLALR